MNPEILKRSEQAKAAIIAVDRPSLTDEIEYRLGVQLDSEDYDGPNYMLALLDAEEWCQDVGGSRALLNACRRALIKINHYRIITAGELSRIQTFGGARKYDFALSGRRYVWTGHDRN